MILDATTRKIQILLGGAVATTECPVVANWVDTTSVSTTPGSTNSQSNGTSAVDIVAAPAASTQRIVQSVAIYNADTANVTVTVRYNDNGTTCIIVKVLIQPGQTLHYTPGSGWQVVTATQQGANKASFSANKNGSDQGSITASTFTKITFTTEVFDTGSYYDAANSKWTPPAGIVLITATILFQANVVDQQIYTCTLYKNGSEKFSNVVLSSGANDAGPSIAYIDTANGTDYYEIYGFGAGAGDKTVEGDTNRSFFQGTML